MFIIFIVLAFFALYIIFGIISKLEDFFMCTCNAISIFSPENVKKIQSIIDKESKEN